MRFRSRSKCSASAGGGAETEPERDALIAAVRNVAAAGVVPVIAAGNDRDDYGLGTVGSPGSAPDSIAVAAVSNTTTSRRRRGSRHPARPPSSSGSR